MKYKLLFFIFDLGHGGAENVLVQLVNSLDLNQYDVTVHTIFDYGVNKDRLKGGVKRKWLFKRQFRGMKYIVRLFHPVFLHKLLIREHYDYEIAFLEGIPTRIISGCKDKHTKKYAWVHCQMESPKSFFNTFFTINGAHRCYRKFDKVAFVSEIAQISFMKKTGWSDIKAGIVHNTIDIDRIKALSKDDLGINLNETVVNICSVGRLAWQKGYPRLINILASLRQNGIENWHFYLLGQGEQREQLETMIQENGLKSKVTLLGYDPNPYRYVSKMDLFVCSSYKEGYSTAVTESIVVGTPVLTTDCAGMKEILGDDAGIIVENDDNSLSYGLQELILHPEKIEPLHQKALIRSHIFSMESTLKEFEDFIHQ